MQNYKFTNKIFVLFCKQKDIFPKNKHLCCLLGREYLGFSA